jgi:phosphomannomutase
MNYVFDVDGTLTPSRGKIDERFAEFFLEFCHSHDVYLVSGSDYLKTLEQLGGPICMAARMIFSCSGNAIYKQGLLVYGRMFELTMDEELSIYKLIDNSPYPIRTGKHIEKRLGSVNVSVLGRNHTPEQRQEYIEWDKRTNERSAIASQLNFMFPGLEAVIGGETGIDIYERGKNKGQVRQYLEGPITFFGDKCDFGGNDYPLAMLADKAYHVKHWSETYFALSGEYK